MSGSTSADAAVAGDGGENGAADANPGGDGDGAVGIDAAVAALGCAGEPDPATAPATLNLSGQVTVLQADGSSAPDANRTVDLVRRPNTSLNGDSTDVNGNYSMSYTTGGAPVEVDVRVAAPPNALGARIFPGRPLFEDRVLDIELIATATFEKVYTDAGVTRAGGTAYAMITVLDCDGNPVAGATVTSSATATIRYDDDTGTPSASATVTGADGRAHLLNLTSGDTTISATLGEVSFRTLDIQAFSSEYTMAELVP